MEKEEFYREMRENSLKLDIELNEEQLEKLYMYMDILLEWNQKMNLTAITDKKEIILKHFVDSLTINKYIDKNKSIIDVGTGAGFPGIPIKIIRDDVEVVLVDSLNKRINFLNEVINKLELKNIKAIHARAEEIGKTEEYREKFDISTSRAVANLSTLSEYLIPLVKINGKCICMKGPDINEEIEQSKVAIKTLGGKIEDIKSFRLPNSDFSRNIVIVKKISKTDKKYPRKAGIPSKEPIR
ncbi:MAG: 16S rRNA (guanine(527)-N(7))-methyltransferase RsmG [Clostridia bacterium]|nr:16S rRNA (guanine(527)-N(7))-methyltransferase RsmG [Clostridia bacterium]